MKLVLELPKDKGYILFVNELAGDENFVPYRDCFFDCEKSERWHADRTIREAWEAEKEEHGSRGGIFNQCRWVGSTGWEFWSSDQDAILRTAMKVAEHLGLELELK
ncbi:MAG: hypothetical protein KGS72_22495 [Cyanobacteria bacterium REEB67]|nr:hypothetical protein [Cyanobacteria bacterium REEB67]